MVIKSVNKLLLTMVVIFVALLGYLWICIDQISNKATTSNVLEPTIFPAATPFPELDSEKLLFLIQEWRDSDDCRPGGCQPYIEDERLCVIARDRVDDGDNYHEGLYEKMNANAYNLKRGVYVAENATGGFSESDMLQRWLNSPSHVEALRKQYKYSCVAVSGSNPNNYYAVQIFSNF